ncbi:MAG: TIGR04372 family glycosyltransferase [Betaproteobacteria bacterium]
MRNRLFAIGRRVHVRFPILSTIALSAIGALFAGVAIMISIADAISPVGHKHAGRRRRGRRPASIPPGLRLLGRAVRSGRGPSGNVRRWSVMTLFAAGSYYMSAGRLPHARECFSLAIELADRNSSECMHFYRCLGATCFLQGDLAAAHAAFADSGEIRSVLLASGRLSKQVRLLGGSWFVAFGHIAMLDFYLKHRELGNTARAPHIVMVDGWGAPPSRFLCEQFVRLGIEAGVDSVTLPDYYDRHKGAEERRWRDLTGDDHRVLVDEFWEYEFPDGAILTYTHGAARIQQQWEAEDRAPLLRLTDEQHRAVAALLAQLEVPRGTWFACVHVREAGFHRRWNAKYPSARDARVEDYLPAIKRITDRGGWVVRMGDRSMTPLPPLDRVVDYAHSPFKCEIGDVLLAASARFLLGTNSGFATIPGIYSVPSVLTNWVPIALPLWFGRDLMVPKMLWHTTERRYLDFRELFSTSLGALQNDFDFPAEIEVRDNAPEEIEVAVIELMDRLEGRLAYSAEDEALQKRYFDLAIECGSYKGSRIGRAFLAQYSYLLSAVPTPSVQEDARKVELAA